MSIQSTVIGNLVNDPDLKFTQSGKAVASTSVAVNHSRKNQQGGYDQTGVTFLRISLWDHLAQEAAEHLRKGQRVIVTGRIETREYEKDGEKRTSLEMQVNEIGPVLAKWPPKDQQQPNGFTSQPQPAQQPDPWGGGQQSQGGWDSPNNGPAPF